MSLEPTMTARERVLASVEHREPDHVAVDLGATPSSGISAVAYANLVKHLGLADQRTLVYDVVQQLAQPSDELLDRLGIDAVDIGRTFNERPEDWHPMVLPSGIEVQVPVLVPPGPPAGRGLGGLRRRRRPHRRDADGRQLLRPDLLPLPGRLPGRLSGLADVMPKVLWSGLVHSPWDHAGEAGLLGAAARADARAARDHAIGR